MSLPLPVVSVIMNTFQENPKYLKEAVDSYLKQEKVNIHLIVSTIEGDFSISFLKREYSNYIRELNEKKYPKIDICISLKKEHPGKGVKGIYYQLNKATKYLEGEWFSYASSNDVAVPNKLQMEIDLCNKSKKSVCYSNFTKTNAFLKNMKSVKFKNPSYLDLLKGNYISDCSLIKTDVLKKFLPFNSKFYNTGYWELWLRIYNTLGNVFVHNPNIAFYYRITNQSEHMKRKTNIEKKLLYQKNHVAMRQSILNRFPLYKIAIIKTKQKSVNGTYSLQNYHVPIWKKGNMVLYYNNNKSWQIVRKRQILAKSEPGNILLWKNRITSPNNI
jgi:arginine repressor